MAHDGGGGQDPIPGLGNGHDGQSSVPESSQPLLAVAPSSSYSQEPSSIYSQEPVQSYSQPPQRQQQQSDFSRKIFVGGLSWDTNEDGLRRYFEKFGVVTEVKVQKDPNTGKSRCFGFVSFDNADICTHIMNDPGPHMIDGRNVTPRLAQPRGPGADNHRAGVSSGSVGGGGGGGSSGGTWDDPYKSKKIFAGGLPLNATEESLKEFFGQYDQVEEVLLMYDRETQRPRGFGFISFANEETVERLVREHYIEVDGKRVEIKRAQEKGRGGGGGGGRGGARGGYGGRDGGGGYGGGYSGGRGRGDRSYGGGGYGRGMQGSHRGGRGDNNNYGGGYNNRGRGGYAQGGAYDGGGAGYGYGQSEYDPSYGAPQNEPAAYGEVPPTTYGGNSASNAYDSYDSYGSAPTGAYGEQNANVGGGSYGGAYSGGYGGGFGNESGGYDPEAYGSNYAATYNEPAAVASSNYVPSDPYGQPVTQGQGYGYGGGSGESGNANNYGYGQGDGGYGNY